MCFFGFGCVFPKNFSKFFVSKISIWIECAFLDSGVLCYIFAFLLCCISGKFFEIFVNNFQYRLNVLFWIQVFCVIFLYFYYAVFPENFSKFL